MQSEKTENKIKVKYFYSQVSLDLNQWRGKENIHPEACGIAHCLLLTVTKSKNS